MAVNLQTIGVAVVDDQHLFRQSLGMLIETIDEFQLIADAANGREFLDKVPAIARQIDIVLVDLDMPVMKGVELNRIIRQDYPDIKVIILSVHAEARIMAQMMDAGAAAYLAKNCDKDELILAIQTVYQKGYYMSSASLAALQDVNQYRNTNQQFTQSLPAISPREKEVLQLICQQHTNAEIAKILYISIRTVEGHRNKLLEKTGCHTTAGLVIFAVKHNLFIIYNHL